MTNINKLTDYSLSEEILNAISHGIGLIVAIVGLVLIIFKAQGALQISSVSIYGGTLVFTRRYPPLITIQKP